MKHTLRCMKNEARLRLMKRGFATRKGTVCFASYEHSECFIEAVRLLLHICVANASFPTPLPDTIKVFGVLFFYHYSVWCKFGASILIVGTHAKKVFTNSIFCGIIRLSSYLLDKLEFDEENYE